MRGAAVGAALLCLGAWVTLGSSDTPRSHKIPVKLIGPGNAFPGQIWGQTYFPPMLSFRVTQGKPPEATTTLCDVITEHRVSGEVKYSVIHLHCEEGLVMELEGIDLEGGRQ